jgi:xylan 1,4-beta-xylosidase
MVKVNSLLRFNLNTARTLLIVFFLHGAFFANAQYQTADNEKGTGYYSNPIFSGDYADPSILRDGDNYYMVHSSFESYPGLLIWHSKDLINWNPVKSALYKKVGSVWAPDLVKYKNKYYIYFPANGTNYVVYADSINGVWSEPIDLKINYIDPGHVTDENGKRYLFFSSGGFVPLSDDGLALAGDFKSSYSGWPIPREWSIECFCMEGPKLIKRGDYYYLTVAEGGTAGPATGHMVISARSKSLWGPWENSPYNPITRTKSNSEKWCSKGHGTILEDAKGKWWMIFHAYENGFYNKGRQTLLQPIEWTKDGWYKIPDEIGDNKPIKKPDLSPSKSTFTLNDKFEGNTLKPQWKFFGEYDTTRFQLTDHGIVIKGKGNNIGNSSPLLCIPSHHSYTAEVELSLEGNAIGGLVLFYNGGASSGILANNENILANLRGWQFETEKKVIKRHVFLRLKNINNTVDMYYSADGIKWNKIENSLEVSGMHHNVLGGFLSLQIGLCSMGEGKATFKNFKYGRIK